MSADPIDSEYKLLGYFDESYDQRQERTLVIAGYVGPEHCWRVLERKWSETLTRFGIDEFHAVDCEHGSAAFKGMSRSHRQDIQKALIELLSGQIDGIFGVFGGIMLEPYGRLRPQFKQKRKIPPGLPISGSFDHPYYLAFQLAVERAAILPAVAALPASEKINFIFDQQRDLGGKVPLLFESMRGDAGLLYTSRLGDVELRSRVGVPGLQAADLLAYEAYRFGDFTGKSTETRWQFNALAPRVSPPGYLNEAGLLKLLE
jgi:hypothetical protein